MKRKRVPQKRGRAPSLTVHVLSDGTGNLARHILTSIAGQFPQDRFEFVWHVFQDTTDKIKSTVRRIRSERSLVLHTLIDTAAKFVVQDECQQKGIPHFDVTGPLVQFLAEHVGVSPANELSRLHEVNEKYFHRIAAIEFATEHDDGLGLGTLREADIVLVGVSRVSKSPAAIWLATHGFKTANVSITVENGFPRELDRVKRKTVALTMQPKRLQEIRVARMSQPELASIGYHDLPTVIKEVMEAEKEYRKRAYPIVDVTSMTIEQTAATVLQKLGLTRDAL